MTGAAKASRPSRVRARVRRGLQALTARPRLLGAACFVALLLAALPAMRVSTRLILSWDLGVTLYLALAMGMMATATEAKMQMRADREDVGATAVLVLAVAAAIASFVAIAFELQGIHDAKGGGGMGDGTAGARLGLVAATILLSWVFVHTMFALHYAHDFYAGETDRGGLAFPGTPKPDYWDFLYFSFTMGAASQTSDVAVTAARTRRFVLAHTVVSFLFNTTILALAINVGASPF